MNVFELRKRVIDDYRDYVKSFISIVDDRIRQKVDEELDDHQLLWPQARIGLNPAFAEGGWIDDLVTDGTLHATCKQVFRLKRDGRTVYVEQRKNPSHKISFQGSEAVRLCGYMYEGTSDVERLARKFDVYDGFLRERVAAAR